MDVLCVWLFNDAWTGRMFWTMIGAIILVWVWLYLAERNEDLNE